MDRTPKIIIAVTAGLIVILLFYGIYKKLDVAKQAADLPQEPAKKLNIWFITTLIAVIALLAVLYMKTARKEKLKILTKDDIKPEIIKRNVYEGNMKGIYNEDWQLELIGDSVRFSDTRPFVMPGTTDQFLAMEVHYTDPFTTPEPGIYTYVMPLTVDMKFIQGGNYSVHEHSSMFNWLREKSFLKKLPLTSPQHERLKFAQMALDYDVEPKDIYPLYDEQQKPVQAQQDESEEEEPEEPQAQPQRRWKPWQKRK